MIGVDVFSLELYGKLFLFFTQWYVCRRRQGPPYYGTFVYTPALLSWPLATGARISKIMAVQLVPDDLQHMPPMGSLGGTQKRSGVKSHLGPQRSYSVMSSLLWGNTATIRGASPLTRRIGNLCPWKARRSYQMPLFAEQSSEPCSPSLRPGCHLSSSPSELLWASDRL